MSEDKMKHSVATITFGFWLTHLLWQFLQVRPSWKQNAYAMQASDAK